jgi:DNA-binding NarL/FixJ family response regulator
VIAVEHRASLLPRHSHCNFFGNARRIRKVSPNSKILFVSQESSADVVQEALKLGAQGYLLKIDAAGELLPAVDAVLQGRQYLSRRLPGI